MVSGTITKTIFITATDEKVMAGVASSLWYNRCTQRGAGKAGRTVGTGCGPTREKSVADRRGWVVVAT